MVIVSASYRTDIPAFYGDWFFNRLREGYCLVGNPYNASKYRVPLRGPEVDGFVFWTKNLGPFRPVLEEVAALSMPFYVQYTITGYPAVLEQTVAPTERTCDHVGQVASLYGPDAVVWRYDPVVLSSVTSRSFHLDNFQRLAERLADHVDEVVVSFAHFYRKTLRQFARVAAQSDLKWEDPSDEEKIELLGDLACLARDFGLRPTVCGQPGLKPPAADETRCIDAERLSRIAGRPILGNRKPHRKECGCYESKDIGAYDSCPHGCIYCYAVRDRRVALAAYKRQESTRTWLGP